MSAMLALQAFSAVAKFAGAMQAGQAEQDARESEAFNIETERVRSQTNALQRHNDRLEQYRLNTKANLATFSATGRDIGRYNVKAFMERQKEITTQDTTRSDIMGMFESMKLAQAARTSRAEGRAAKQSATIRAYTGLVDSGIKFAEAGGFEKSSWKV